MYRRRSRSRTWDICRVKRRFETDHRPGTRELERPDADPWTSQKDPVQRLHSDNWDCVRVSLQRGSLQRGSLQRGTAGQRETGKRAKYNAATPTCERDLQSVVWQRWSEVVRVQLGTRPGQWAVATWGPRYVAVHSVAKRGQHWIKAFCTWQEKDEGGTGDSDDLLLDQFMVGLRRGLVKQELSRQLRRRDGTTFKAACTEARALEQELQVEEESLVVVSQLTSRPNSQ
uniref:Uncharacterized protein n=1 Tax=Knipowitschia caucasica TaxID=637954 RepID=A0AAV2MDP0_KNICA